MRYYEAFADIRSDPDTVWKVLTDGTRYSSWDSGVDRVEGRIDKGETIKVHAKISPGRTFPVKVTEFFPGNRMVWVGGMPFGLFKGMRIFTLSAHGEGTTRVTVREEYTGPMLGMMWKSMPDLGPSFETFVQGLKTKAESIH
jgi:hypothetical protein